VAVLIGALVGPPLAAGVAVATFMLVPLPATLPDAPRRPADSLPSTVLAADGSVIGEFKEAVSRVALPVGSMPDTVRRAVVAAEDRDFFRHGGIDVGGIARALWADLRTGRAAQGGSTITQQLVKNLYTGNERTLGRKAKDAYLAIQMERVLEKEEILTRYLNNVYFGDSTFGIEAASRSYFHKPAADLNLSEAALLAGVIPAPSAYSPRRHPEEAEHKRQVVLDRLLATGLAPAAEVAAARAAPPAVQPPPVVEGRFPFFLDYLRVYLLDIKGYPPDLLYRGGLRIETTLDPRLQARGEALAARFDRLEDPETSIVAVEPATGYVQTLVGGRDWNASHVNLALGRLGGGSGRQAGSAFKPFVLARALDAGMAPTRVYPAPSQIQPPGFDKPVSNYEGGAYGSADLRLATEKSINTVFVQLISDVGVRETAETARALGIRDLDPDKPVYGGIAIGTQEVSTLDMASAYGVFAARGLRAEPTPVVRITRPEAGVVEDNTAPQGQRVLEEPVADTVTDLLEGVVLRGTGTAAGIGRPVAGKTGTSQNYENAWFVGYTPALSTAVWMGHAEGNIPMRNVRGVGAVAGGTLPARLWHDFMAAALDGVPATDFTDPAPIEPFAERAKREERGGVDPGDGGPVADLPADGPFIPDLAPPQAVDPAVTSSTTTAPPSTTTTTTTAERGRDDDDD
jgi:penicillin-binding protein 1A